MNRPFRDSRSAEWELSRRGREGYFRQQRVVAAEARLSYDPAAAGLIDQLCGPSRIPTNQ